MPKQVPVGVPMGDRRPGLLGMVAGGRGQRADGVAKDLVASTARRGASWTMKSRRSSDSPIPMTRYDPSDADTRNKTWNDWKEWDQLKRDELADKLHRLVAGRRKEPLTISLDGQWGTGKTFFLKLWEKYLKTHEITVIYYNAWDDDYCSDPLAPLLHHIKEGIKSSDRANGLGRKLSRYYNASKLSSCGSKLSKLQFGVSMGLLSSLCVSVTLSHKTHHGSLLKAKKKLKDALVKITAPLRAPLVLIVDELDRCRPDYALGMLERTKHLLNVPGIVFVYGVNRRELIKSIEHVYGGIDTDVYVRRFFDMNLTLLSPGGTDREGYIMWLLEKYEVQQNDKDRIDFEKLAEMAQRVIGPNAGLSLRDIEHCVRIVALVAARWTPHRISIIKPQTKPQTLLQDVYAAVVAIIVVRLQNDTLYRSFADGDSDDVVKEIIKFLTKKANESSQSEPWYNDLWRDIEKALTKMFNESVRTTHYEIVTLIELVSALPRMEEE